jgi:hypothetical protein
MPIYSKIVTDRAVRCRWLPATMNTLGRWCNVVDTCILVCLRNDISCRSAVGPEKLRGTSTAITLCKLSAEKHNHSIAHGRREPRKIKISGLITISDHADRVSPKPIQSMLASPRNISVHKVASSTAPRVMISPPESCSPAWKGKDVVVVWFRKEPQSKSLAAVGQLLWTYGVAVLGADIESRCVSDLLLVW